MKVFTRAAMAALIAATTGAGTALAAPRLALLFHKQNGYIHTATDSVVARIKSDLAANGLTVESTVDSLAFTSQNLARFGAVIFLNTNYRNGPLLARAQEAAFEGFVHGGGGFVGLHSAVPLNGTAEEAVWPWYAQLFGARFKSHPDPRTAPFVVEYTDHYSTRGLPARINLWDEWYAVQSNPRTLPGVKILATVDETGFPAGSGMGGDHPVSWYREFEGARTWMTLVGHNMQAFSNPNFMAHVRGGILWAGGWDAPAALRGKEGALPGRDGTDGESGRAATWIYAGRDGTNLEVRADGRAITARRLLGASPPPR